MATADDYDFSSGDAGASHVFNMEAGQIRVGGYICIKEHPCKVSAVSTSKTGKHGHAKCNFTAIDIFTGKKYEVCQAPPPHQPHILLSLHRISPFPPSSSLSRFPQDIIPSTHTAHVPNVTRKDYSLVDITDEDFTSLMDEEGNCREDIKLPDVPDNFGREIRTAFDSGKSITVSVLSAMGHEQIIALKEEADK